MTIAFDLDCYSAPYVTVHERRAVSTTAPIAHRYRQVNQRKVRRFVLSFAEDTPYTAIQHIVELWQQAKSTVAALTFTPVGESPIDVRFISMKTTRQNAAQGTATVELEELL